MASFLSRRKAREIACKFLLPIPISEICRRHGIELFFYDAMSVIGACYIDFHGRKIIVVNDNVPRGRVRFSIAHELGHVILNHSSPALSMPSVTKHPTDHEVDANVFAAELLMPKMHLQAYGMLSPEGIAKICDVSLEAAKIRAKEFGWM